jgi:ATP-dependent exoDNAse (exonuclease V) beta subunit
MTRLTAVTASGGAGKTTRIVGDIATEVSVRPLEEIVATTFTIKAADELVERARARLFGGGQAEAAARLLGARFGTVNAVCGQLVSEFALDLGRSPSTAVIGAENESIIFSMAADQAIAAHASVLNTLADRFGYNDPRPPFGGEGPDWRRTVRQIVALARSNGLDVSGLLAAADRSIDTYRQLPPAAAQDGAALDRELTEALAAVMAVRPAELSAKAKKPMEVIRAAHQRARRGEPLSWPTWARLAKAECAPTKDGPAFAAAVTILAAAAGRHADHPRLRVETETFIRSTFACAAEALASYQDWKAQRGLLDFTDQEALALDVLRDPAMAARARERISRVFVDEFQDSSPLQLAVFTALSGLVEQSTWVGDPKQAIYGFRGADTDLTQAAFAGAAASGTDADVLSTSWRSREGIVALSNALFTPAFERMGLPASSNAFTGTHRSEVGFDRSALGWWTLAGKADEQAQALAAQITASLADGAAWLVEDERGEHRSLSIGDIAVLCRTNTDVSRYARALSQAGLPVAVERGGLARTPHVELILAACRWVADASDRLALAELARFFSDDPGSDAWLVAAAGDDPDTALSELVPVSGALAAFRAESLNLTPAELVDAVATLPEVMVRIERWGDTAIRFDDLEALRGFGRAYEEECASSSAPATLPGLILALDGAHPKRPPSLAAEAIQVMTYHGAKGLEWPMTVLTGLGSEPKARLFEPVAEVDGVMNWREPLANRWIRFWPWPYDVAGSGSALEAAAADSPFGRSAWRRAAQEDTRLLYVGVTRARDYLIFAPPPKSPAWFKVLDEVDGAPHVVPPAADDNLITVGGRTFVEDVRVLSAGEDAKPRYPLAPHVNARITSAPISPLFLKPSSASGDGWRVAERVDLGPRLGIDGANDMAALGEALHAILAYDDVARRQDQRLADAEAILGRWSIPALSAADAIEASTRLQTWVADRWPGGEVLREAPIRARVADQIVQGRIDLLVRHAARTAILDHKSFPGAFDAWESRALNSAPQVGLYGQAIEAASGAACDEFWIHMPVVGALLRVQRTADHIQDQRPRAQAVADEDVF